MAFKLTTRLLCNNQVLGSGRYSFLTDTQKLARGIWPWTEGIRSRLPDHYKRRYTELHQAMPEPLHWKPNVAKWEVDEFGVRTHVENTPIPVIMPRASQRGLWGGEGFVQGLRRRGNVKEKPAMPRLWKCALTKRVFYSEILDKYLAIQVTFTALDKIDEVYGFDNYILKTDEVNLKSQLGMKIKADMIRTLIHKSMYPNDPKKCEEIYEKYKEFIVPEEELEWYGLTLREAEHRQIRLEWEQRESDRPPHKLLYADQLLRELREGQHNESGEDEKSGILSKLNPFEAKKPNQKSQ